MTAAFKNPSGSRTSSCLPDDIAAISLHHGILADVGDEEEQLFYFIICRFFLARIPTGIAMSAHAPISQRPSASQAAAGL